MDCGRVLPAQLRLWHRGWRARCLPFGLGLSIALLCGMGCGDRQRVTYATFRVFQLEHADTLRAGVSNLLWVGAQVGYDGCVPEQVRIQQRGDSLFVTGQARCVEYDDYNGPTTPGIAGLVGPNPRWLSLLLPPLAPGIYVVCGNGLCDTLVAAKASARSQIWIASRGVIYAFSGAKCPDRVAHYRTWDDLHHYEILNPPAEDWLQCEIHAVLAGAACDSADAGALRLRRWTRWSP